jgi:site-specific DNA-cytosine methylase
LSFIDLFCGGGFFSCGFKQAGFVPQFGVDKAADACRTYELNIAKAYCIDIKLFSAKHLKGKIDVVIGSSPCIPFSKANYQNKTLDMTLTDHYFRIIKEIQPKIWVLENVPTIYPFVDAPYKEIHNLSDYGLLQDRQRFLASNVKITIEKPKNKYLSKIQTEKLSAFRPEAIHRHYQTTTCRYNSFTHTDAHIKDDFGIHVLSHEEAMQIQTIPFDYKFPNLPQRRTEYLIGNAVPPMFAYKIACAVKTQTKSLFDFPLFALCHAHEKLKEKI